MKKHRDLLELLKLMYEYTKTEKDYAGLCATVCEMHYLKIITSIERYILNKYIDQNPIPNFDGRWGWYWWKEGNKYPRLKWLKEQSKILEQ